MVQSVEHTRSRARRWYSAPTITNARRRLSSPLVLPAPLWSRVAASAFIVVLVPYYWMHEGWRNFLWLSDISLFATGIALWVESPLLNSMMCIGVLPFELYWNATFFTRLLTGIEIGEIPDYMFDGSLPLPLRLISLFHVVLPVIWILLLRRWGYDRRAIKLQTVALSVILLLTYGLTGPELNINWVYLPYKLHLAWLPQHAWLLAYMVIVPALVYWPTHVFYSRCAPRAR